LADCMASLGVDEGMVVETNFQDAPGVG